MSSTLRLDSGVRHCRAWGYDLFVSASGIEAGCAAGVNAGGSLGIPVHGDETIWKDDSRFSDGGSMGSTTGSSVRGGLAIYVVHDDDVRWDLGGLKAEPQLLVQRGSH